MCFITNNKRRLDLFRRILRRNLYLAKRFFISLCNTPAAFTHDGVFMYYCSCLHNWQWRRWLASPRTTHQRLALKRLPHRKCMAKLWNVITPLPYFQMKCFSGMFSGSRRATNWTKFEVRTMFSWWVIKRFWGISSTPTYYNMVLGCVQGWVEYTNNLLCKPYDVIIQGCYHKSAKIHC